MVLLQAEIHGDNIIISKDSFEHIMNCLANQKFVGEPPMNGDSMAVGEKNYKETQQKIQAAIDDCWRQGMDLLSKS